MRCWTLALLALASLAATPLISQQAPPTAEIELETPTETRAPTSERLTRADLEAWLDGYMPYALQSGDVAGAVVAVVKDGEIILSKGYGYADAEERIPVSGDRTLFRPGSVAKLFTWTAVMQLVEQGKLDLDEDINTYLDFEIPRKDGKPVTLRDIMTHTAGFEERVKNLITDDPDNLMPLSEYYHGWIPEQIHPVGTTPAYSNYATGLAGYIVERVSGQPFNEYIEEHIFEPLEMDNSTFRQPLPPRLADHMSKGYMVASGPAMPYEFVTPGPAGALSSTGSDMAKFMIAHLNQGGPLLEPDMARTMHRSMRTIFPELNRMALGFFETDTNGRNVVAHLGDTQWFHTALHLFIDDGVGLYISVNSLGKNGAAGTIRTALFEGFADRYLPGPAPSGKVDIELAKKHAAMMAGLYDSSRRADSSFLAIGNLLGQTTVTDNGDGTITVPGLSNLADVPKVWREIAPFVWVEQYGDERLAALVIDGEIARFSVDGLPFMLFEPVPWWKSSAWLMPLLYASIAAFLLTVLLWPVAALVRRRYQAGLPLAGPDLKAYRWVRIGAIATLAILAGWSALVSVVFSMNIDAWLWILQILSLVVFFGMLAIAFWNAWRVWKGDRRWPAKVWSIVLVIAALTVLHVALTFNLIGFGVNF